MPNFPISPSNTNNAPTLTLSATNTRINNDSAVKIFNNVNAGGGVSGNGVADTGSSSIIKQIVFTVKAVKDFASEIVTIDGVSIPLVNTPADVSFTNGGSYFVTVIGSAVQVTLKNLSLSTADDNNQVNSLIESITYQNISTTPTDGTRQILVSKITDGGVTSSPSNPYAGSNYKDFGNTLLSNVTVDTLAPNAPSTLSVPENDNGGISVAEASDGTMVIVSLVGTMAAVNDVISVVIDGASTLYTITQNDIDAESASVSIPKSVLDLAGYGSAQVTATIKDATSNVSQASQPVTINVIAPNALPTGEVTILGTPTQGQILTATNNLADANGMGTVSYTWYADGAEISGATGNTFTLTQAQVDKKMTVTARYFDGQNTAESVTSSQTAKVANINDAPTGLVTITGTATQGQVLTASNTLADVDGLGTVSYKWYANGTEISGATAATYTLTQAEVGKAITAKASYTDGGNTVETVSSSATANVANINDAPTSVDKTVTINEDASQIFAVSDFGLTDAAGESDTLSAVIISTLPALGTLTLNNVNVVQGQRIPIATIPTLKYTPALNGNGLNYASIGFKVQDNGGTANGGVDTSVIANTLTIHVTPVNDAPVVVTTPTTLTTLEDTATSFVINTQLAGKVTDADGTALKAIGIWQNTSTNGIWAYSTDGAVTWTNFPSSLTSTPNGTGVMYLNATDSLRFTPTANANGTALGSLNYRAIDATFGTFATGAIVNTNANYGGTGAVSLANGYLNVDVTAVNEAPILTTTSTRAYTENGAAAAINTVITVADLDNTTLASGTVSISTGFALGQDVLSFTNVPATMGNIAGSYNATTGVMTLTSASSTATIAQWQVAMRAVSYSNTSNTPTTAARTVSYVINDGVVNSTAFTSKINVMSVNDAPSATSSTITVLEDSSKTFAASDFGFSDVDGNTLSAVIISTLPAAGTLTLNNVNVVQGQRIPVATIPTLKYTPALNMNGLNYASVGFNVQDNGGVANGGIDTSVTANTLIIHVTAVNDAPVGVNDSDNAIEASGVANATAGINPSGNVLNNDTDVDNATNTLTIKSILKGMTGTATAVTASTTSTNGTSIAGTYGTLVMGADGSYIYSVNQSNVTVQALNVGSAPLSDVFTYTVKDPLGLTSTATITVMVNGANDAAVIAGTSTATLTETNIAQSTSGTLTITDVDSATTFVAQTNVAGSNGYGKFSVTTAGAWTYTMNTAHDEFIAGQAYTDSLTVTSADGTSKLVTVTINGADDAAYISGTSTASLTETDGIQTANGTVAVMDVDSAVNNTFVAQTNVAKTYGNFTISTAGVWSYVMSSAHNEFVEGTNYTDSITVASVTGASKVITVTMVGTNDAAVIGGVNTASLTESNIVQSTGGTLTISDVDSTASFASYVTGSNGYGTFTLSTTGVWTYSMNTAHDEFLLGQVYTDSMTVKAVDGTTKLVTVSMTGTNDAPTLSYIDTGSSNTDAITNSAAMSVSSLEASATWQYQVDGGTWQTGTGTTFTMSEGTHDYNVRQKDTLNNVSATTSKTVTLDTVAPNAAGVTLASDTGASNTDGATNNGTVNVSLSSDTNNWQYSTNGGTTWSNGTGTTFSLGAGTYAANSVQVQAFDKAGNVALTKYAPALTVDKSAPTVSVAIGNTALPFGQSTTVNFNFSEAVYGFANADVSVSGGSLSNITGSGQSYSATFTAGYSYNAGSYVSVNANTYTDQAGNNGGSNSTGAFRVGPNVADVARNMSLYVGYYGHNGSDPYGYIDIRLSGNNDLQGATVTLYDGWGHSWSRTVQGAGGTTDFGQITGTGDNVTRYHADITYAGISASIGGGVAYEVTSRGLFNWGIFKCISSDTAYSFCYTSPIVLDLNGDGVQTVDTAHGVQFDMAGDGMKESIGWVDSHDALLVRDINHDGQINDGTELFGSESVLKNGEKAGDGWSALADVDSNGDGKIDAADAVFAEIKVWVDANSDGVAETGELRSLSDAGIQHIDVAHATSNTTQNNNVLFGTGQFTFTDGTTAAMTDAWFDVGQTLSLDFTQVNGQPIDMTDGQAQTLQLNVQDLLAYTQLNGALQILGDAIDAVNIVNDGVAVVAQSQIINNQILNAYDVNQDGVNDLLILLAINQTSLFTVH